MRRLVVLLIWLPVAAAQAPVGIEVTADDDVERAVLPDATADIDYTVRVGCGEFLAQASSTLTVTLDATLPDGWTVDDVPVTFSADADCVVGQGYQEGTATLRVSPTMEATGLQPLLLTTTATSGDATDSYTHTGNLSAAYAGDFTTTTSVQFPYNFTAADDGVLEFDYRYTVSTNAAAMAMFKNISTSGLLEGFLQSWTFDVPGGETEHTFQIRWTPPEQTWETAAISFHTFVHHPSTEALTVRAEDVRWEIHNGQPPAAKKNSPGLGALVVPAIVAVALLRRRR